MGADVSDAAREEAALEEARHRAEEIRATDEAAQAAAVEISPFPDAEIARVHRSGRQNDHAGTDTAAYQRRELGHRRGPRR
jgi:hypothetical protein